MTTHRCPVTGCVNTADPRMSAHDAAGNVVEICDGHRVRCNAPDEPCSCPPIPAGAGGPSAWHEAQERRGEP